MVAGCVCPCPVHNKHYCCDTPNFCSFCTNSFLPWCPFWSFCLFLWLPLLPTSVILFRSGLLVNMSSFIFFCWWQVLHSSWLPAVCVPVVLFYLVLSLLPLLQGTCSILVWWYYCCFHVFVPLHCCIICRQCMLLQTIAGIFFIFWCFCWILPTLSLFLQRISQIHTSDQPNVW